MVWTQFEYLSARTVDEAVELWHAADEARYLAGGTDMIPQVRCGARRSPKTLVDIKRIPGLWEIGEQDGGLLIGATATIAAVAAHPLVRERYPALTACCQQLGSYPLRNIATAAGNICNASPCADTAAALLCLEAEVLTRGAKGARRIPVTGLFQGPGMTALAAGELVTGIFLPNTTRGARYHHERIARRRGVDISTAAALVVHLEQSSPHHRIALLSVAPTPLRVPAAEGLLDQRGPAAASQAAEIARQACNPIDDLRGTAAYRRDMVAVMVQRGVEQLAAGRRN